MLPELISHDEPRRVQNFLSHDTSSIVRTPLIDKTNKPTITLTVPSRRCSSIRLPISTPEVNAEDAEDAVDTLEVH